MSEERLSVRLEMHAKIASSRAHWAEVGVGDNVEFWKAFAADLEAAAQLARRVEEAPVRGVLRDNANYLYIGVGTAGFTEGQRVRLVREE